MNLDAYLTLSIKINSKWMKELNTKAETIKFLEENFITLDFSNAFLNITPKVQSMKEEIDMMYFIKIFKTLLCERDY